MTQQEDALLRKYAENNAELRALLDEHILFKKKLDMLNGKKFLTPKEQQDVALLKKQKLDGKTRMFALLDELRSEKDA